jgi:Cd2+/Zn2+-exporting ATPase
MKATARLMAEGIKMTEPTREATCDWTVSGMDCGSCATKIKDAVARLPGVSGVEVGIMSERLRLTLDEALTGRDKIEKTVRALGYEIAPRAASATKDFVLPGANVEKAHDDDHAAHDHGPKDNTTAKQDDSGHGSPGHVHDDPADRGKRWYQTGKGKLVIFTALLLGAAYAVALINPQFGRWAFIAACLIGVAPVAQRAFAALRMGQPFTIESLMTIAAIGALFIDAAEEAALVVFLFAVGEVLEGVAAGKAFAKGYREYGRCKDKHEKLKNLYMVLHKYHTFLTETAKLKVVVSFQLLTLKASYLHRAAEEAEQPAATALKMITEEGVN